MKRFRKLAKAIQSVCLALALAVMTAAPAFAAFDQSVLDGVVMLYSGAPDESGNMQYWRGTGFFVGTEGENPEYIITNCHVVEEYILAGRPWEADSSTLCSMTATRRKPIWWFMIMPRTWRF